MDGTPLRLPVRLREAQARGVTVVHQSLGLVDAHTVVEDLRVGRFRANRLTRAIRWREEGQDAAAVLERLGHPVPLDKRVGELSEEERATVAIARALQDAGTGRGIIMFDESTRSLSRTSMDPFYDLLDDFVATGTSVPLISHHMEEVLEATDRVTVLRDGVVVDQGLRTAELTTSSPSGSASSTSGRPTAASSSESSAAATSRRCCWPSGWPPERELAVLSDHVLVLLEGRVVSELSGEFTPDDIVTSLFSGHIRKTLRSKSGGPARG